MTIPDGARSPSLESEQGGGQIVLSHIWQDGLGGLGSEVGISIKKKPGTPPHARRTVIGAGQGPPGPPRPPGSEGRTQQMMVRGLLEGLPQGQEGLFGEVGTH